MSVPASVSRVIKVLTCALTRLSEDRSKRSVSSASSSRTRASPISIMIVRPLGSSMRLWGLTSRWMTPMAWAYSSAAAASLMTRGIDRRKRTRLLDAPRQVQPFHERHRLVDQVSLLIDVVRHDDVRMAQRQAGLGLAEETTD